MSLTSLDVIAICLRQQFMLNVSHSTEYSVSLTRPLAMYYLKQGSSQTVSSDFTVSYFADSRFRGRVGLWLGLSVRISWLGLGS